VKVDFISSLYRTHQSCLLTSTITYFFRCFASEKLSLIPPITVFKVVPKFSVTYLTCQSSLLAKPTRIRTHDSLSWKSWEPSSRINLNGFSSTPVDILHPQMRLILTTAYIYIYIHEGFAEGRHYLIALAFLVFRYPTRVSTRKYSSRHSWVVLSTLFRTYRVRTSSVWQTIFIEVLCFFLVSTHIFVCVCVRVRARAPVCIHNVKV
jgi:hypothetical protein